MPSKTLKKKPRRTERAEETPNAQGPAANAEQPVPAEDVPGDVDFFARIQSLTPEDWQAGLKVYVYRTWPVIDRRDQEHFLAKLSETFDEDTLLRFFGSGKYNLRLNNGQGHTIAQKTVAIHNPDFPPKVSPDEVVVSDPRNEKYFAVFAPKATEATASRASTDGRSPRAGGSEVTDAAVRLAIAQSEGRDKLAEQLAARAATPVTPPNPLADLKTLAEVIKSLQPPAASGDKPDLVAILRDELKEVRSQLAEDRAEQRRLQQELFDAKTAAPAAIDPIDEVTKALGAVSRIRQIMPGNEDLGSVTEPNGWLTFLSGPVGATLVNQVAAPLTSVLVQWFVQRMSGRPLPPEPAAAVATGQTPRPAPQQPLMQPGQAPQFPPNLIGIVNSLSPMMLRWMQTDSPGDELGGDLAQFAWESYGVEDLTALQQLGVDRIVDLYRGTPVWTILAPMETKFRRLVEGFVNWVPPQEQLEDREQPQGDQPGAEIVDLS